MGTAWVDFAAGKARRARLSRNRTSQIQVLTDSRAHGNDKCFMILIYLLHWDMFIKRFFTLILISNLLLFVPACKQNQGSAEYQSASSKLIKIGLSLPLVGPEASYGRDLLQGVQLAVAEIETQGGVLGRRIQLIVKDNQSKSGENSVIIRELINRDHVSALIGEGVSGRSFEAAPIAQKNQIPTIFAGATNIKVTKMGNFIFRMCFTDIYQGKVLAKFARSLGLQKIAIILDNSTDYSIGLAQSFAQDFVAQGGKIVAQQYYSGSDKDFSAQLTALKAARPDAIFLPAYYTEASSIITQARQIGLEVPFLGGDGWGSPEFLKMGAQAIEGAYFTNHFSSENQAAVVQNFVKEYKQKYGELPSAFAALGYDSVKLLAHAIQQAGTVDPIQVRNALAATQNFPAVTGMITFDEDRNPTKAAIIIKVQNGKFTYLKSVEL